MPRHSEPKFKRSGCHQRFGPNRRSSATSKTVDERLQLGFTMAEARSNDDSIAKPPAAVAAATPASPERTPTAGTSPPPQALVSAATSPNPSPQRRSRQTKTARQLSRGGAEGSTMDADSSTIDAQLVVDAFAPAAAGATVVDVAIATPREEKEDVAAHGAAAAEFDAQRSAQAPPPAPSLVVAESTINAEDNCATASAASHGAEMDKTVVLASVFSASTCENEAAARIEAAEVLGAEEEGEWTDEPQKGDPTDSESGGGSSPSLLASPNHDASSGSEAMQRSTPVAFSGDATLGKAPHDELSHASDVSFPLPILVSGPVCSTLEGKSEKQERTVDSVSADDERESSCELPSSGVQARERQTSSQSAESPKGNEGSTTKPVALPDSPVKPSGSPSSVDAAPRLESASAFAKSSTQSPSSPAVLSKGKKSTTTAPPPAPIAPKKIAKPAVSRSAALSSTAASRVSTTKAPTAAKSSKKPTYSGKAVKPISTSGATRTENPKKTVPAKTVAAKKSVPKAVVYSVSATPRYKRATMAQGNSKSVKDANPPSPAKRLDTEGGVGAVAACIGQDGTKFPPKRMSKAKSEAASNRLYEDAKAAKLRKEARSAEVDEACTFAPNVSHAGAGATKRPSLGEMDRFLALHEDARQLQAKKQELQRKHDEATCTFRPSITSKAKKLARETTRPRYENLYMQAREIKQKREDKALAKRKEDEVECSFRPKVKPPKSPVQSKPLYDAEREKQKQLQLEQKRKEAEMSECTFKPKLLSKKSNVKADVSVGEAEEGEIYDRLYRAGKVQAERIERLRKEREDEEKAKAPFQPKLLTTSHKAKESDAQPKEPFHMRLYKKDHVQKLSAEREQQKLEEERRFSYKPKISEMPEEIKAKQKEYTSPDKPIFERLYEEKERIKEKLQASEEVRVQNEMAECTFRPSVSSTNASGNSSASSPPVWKRLSICHKNQVVEEREKLKQQLEMQECTFKPAISPSDHVSPYRSSSYLTRRHSNRSESCSPSFEDPTRKGSFKSPRSLPDSRFAPVEFLPVSIGSILKSSTLVLSEEKSGTTSASASAPSSVAKTNGLSASEGDGVDPSSTLDSRRPSPVRKPTETQGRDGAKSATDSDDTTNSPLPVARSLDAEFEKEGVAASI